MTHKDFPTHTGKIGPINPFSITRHSASIEPLHNGRSDMLWVIQRAIRKVAASQSRTIHSKTHGVCPIHKEILDPSVFYRVLGTQLESSPYSNGEVCFAMNDSKSYYTRKMAASQSCTTHSKTHGICPTHTRNIVPIGPLSSTRHSDWVPTGRSDILWMIQRAIVLKMTALQSGATHSKTHKLCPIHTRNIRPIIDLWSSIIH